ncbi:hypothetical protein ACIBCC_36725 [Streptomyces griseus]|uniref:hypothetical protein n=1 Tax=Streptomyces griseus TaxID=1911 RepID=UPI0037A127A7
MTFPIAGKIYHIKNKKSGLFYAGVFFSVEPVGLVFHRASVNPEQWMISVVSFRKGDPAEWNGFICGAEIPDGQQDYQGNAGAPDYWGDDNHRKGGALWEVKSGGSGYSRLWSTASGQYALDGNHLRKFVQFADDAASDGSDLFSMEEVGSFPAVVNLKKPAVTSPDSPVLKNMNEPPADVPDEKGVLTGVAAVPYFVIKNDHGKSYYWQGEKTPYYIIEKWSRFHRVGWRTFAAHKTDEYGWSTTVGVTKETGKTISDTTSFNITANAGFSFGGLSAGISASFGHDLNVTTTESTTTSYTHEVHHNQSITPNHDQALATWYPVHKYIIYRADGQTDILNFEVTVPEEDVETTYEAKG